MAVGGLSECESEPKSLRMLPDPRGPKLLSFDGQTCKFSPSDHLPSYMLNRFILPPTQSTHSLAWPTFLSKYLLFDDALHTYPHTFRASLSTLASKCVPFPSSVHILRGPRMKNIEFSIFLGAFYFFFVSSSKKSGKNSNYIFFPRTRGGEAKRSAYKSGCC